MLSFERFIAWRYLFSRERGALVSLITLISVAGVALGVAALIVVIGVMDGADDQLFGRMAGLYPHVRIIDTNPGDKSMDPALVARLAADPRVARAEPVLEKKTVIQGSKSEGGRPALIQLIGVDSIGKGSLFPMQELLKDGRIDIAYRDILLGAPLGQRLHLFRGMDVYAMSTNPQMLIAGPMTKTMKLRVFPQGLVKTGIAEFDSVTAFVSRQTFCELYLLDANAADYIYVKLKNPFSADAFKKSLQLPPGYKATTWSEENSDFFGALRLEKTGLGLTLLLTVLVAAFNIIGTLILTVMEKTREIGLLRAVGASEKTIARIFMLDGVMIGIVGVGAGAALGVGLCLGIRALHFDLPSAVYAFDALPVSIKPLTIALVTGSAMAICTLGALFPARQASRLDPVEALRHD